MLANTAHAATWQAPMKTDNAGVQYIRNGSSAAYGDSYPNASRQMEYVVSYDDFTDITRTDILVYMPTQFGTIQIVNKDLCVNTQTSIANSDADYAPAMPAGTAATEYRLIRPDGVSIQFAQGFWDYSGPGACANNTVNMVASAPLASSVPRDPDSGMYVYRITANVRPGGAGGKFANGFHIVAPAGSYISQDSNSAASNFGLQPSYPIPGNNPVTPTPPNPYRVYTDMDIPFGPDCSLAPGQNSTQTFDIYDADNVGNYDVQPQPFHVQLLRHNRTTGAYIGTVDLNLVSGAAVQAAPIANNVWRPTGGNQTTTRFSFVANGSEIYKLRIYNLYYDNTLQFKIPYDSVWFFKQCARPVPTTVRPVVTLNPNPAENGETLTGTAHIENASNNAVASPVSYTRRVWSDTDRNGVWTAGERLFGGTPQSGAAVVPPSPGVSNLATWTDIADTGVHGGRICISLTVTASAPVTVVSSPAVVCADIGKKPKLQVATGDIFVGGTFRDPSGTCALQTVTPTTLRLQGSISTVGAAVYGSYADYGAFNLGETTNFGSNGYPPGGAALNLTFGNDPAPLGYFYSNNTPTRSDPVRARCLNDPFAFFGPRATPDTAATTIDPSAGSVAPTSNGVVTISGAVLTPGYRAVIYAKNASEVVINGNITYAEGPYASIDQIPQLVILSKGRITVREGVTRLDGIYATKGDFLTCDIAPSLSKCNQQLVVNGAVIVGGQVAPYRTFGAQKPNYADKAEIFRLRPDVLLNQVVAPGEPTTIRTINQREVPPRF